MPFINPDELKNGFAIAARHASFAISRRLIIHIEQSNFIRSFPEPPCIACGWVQGLFNKMLQMLIQMEN